MLRGHRHGNELEVAHEFVEPEQPIAFPRDDPVLRLVRGQVGEDDVHSADLRRRPQREDTRQGQGPEGQPDGQIGEGPDDGAPRKAPHELVGDRTLQA